MEMYEGLKHILGLDLEPKELNFIQISLRGVIVFVVALTMVRFGNKRFLSKMTAFDAILGFILASMLARAVNGSGRLWWKQRTPPRIVRTPILRLSITAWPSGAVRSERQWLWLIRC